MKKHFISTLPGFIFLLVMSSCFHNHNIEITISDDDDEYEMEALYKRNQTRTVQVYLDENLLNNSTVSFKRRTIDEEVTLDDNTTVYINSNPGNLSIKNDKTKNSAESCERVKQVCEELKDILADN